MNESLIALAGVLIPALGGLGMFLVNNIHKRIDGVESDHGDRISTLEVNHEKTQEIKLSKEDYYRDQGVQRATLARIEEDLKTLPDRILNTFKLLGKL